MKPPISTSALRQTLMWMYVVSQVNLILTSEIRGGEGDTVAMTTQQSHYNDHAHHNFGSGLCRDRFGFFPEPVFRVLTCRSCYIYLDYLFPGKQHLYYKQLNEHLFAQHDNHSSSATDAEVPEAEVDWTVSSWPDPVNETTMHAGCVDLDRDECLSWQLCCREAAHCCSTQLALVNVTVPPDHCPRTWDGWDCWDSAPPDTFVYHKCPAFGERLLAYRQSSKHCTENGTWFAREDNEWTDYTDCVDLTGYLPTVYIWIVCSALSITLLVPAIIIFIGFRDLRCQQRIRIHINFFVALTLSCMANILWYSLIHHDLLTTEAIVESVISRNPVWCRVLSSLKLYFSSACYFWMFCEGYFLHRLITSAFRPPKSLLTLYLVGWVCPAIPVVTCTILRIYQSETECWTTSSDNLVWIVYLPNLLCLLINCVFLCNILRILVFKLQVQPAEPGHFRRGVKAACMLIPLFGLQMFLTAYTPNLSYPASLYYENVSYVIQSSQGVFVSLIFCFINGEVIMHLQTAGLCPHWRCCDIITRRRRLYSTQMTQMTIVDLERRRSSTSQWSWSNNSKESLGSLAVRMNGTPRLPRVDDVEEDEQLAAADDVSYRGGDDAANRSGGGSSDIASKRSDSDAAATTSLMAMTSLAPQSPVVAAVSSEDEAERSLLNPHQSSFTSKRPSALYTVRNGTKVKATNGSAGATDIGVTRV